VTRWTIRYYAVRYVLLHDGQYVAEHVDPILLILGVSYQRHQEGVLQ
jgi:hypothetical protein